MGAACEAPIVSDASSHELKESSIKPFEILDEDSNASVECMEVEKSILATPTKSPTKDLNGATEFESKTDASVADKSETADKIDSIDTETPKTTKTKEKSARCGICSKKFEQIRDHMQSAHGIGAGAKRQYVCSDCGKSFPS